MPAASNVPQWGPVSNVDIIESYYRTEFPDYIDQLPEWISLTSPHEFGVSLTGWHPTADDDDQERREFIRRDSRVGDSNDQARFDSWEALIQFLADPANEDPLDAGGLRPTANTNLDPVGSEAVYYGLDSYDRFWVLAFDIDAKDIAAIADIPDSDIERQPPEGYQYRFSDIDAAIDYAFDLEDYLTSKLEFDRTYVVYSGQGAHVYGLDDDQAHQYTKRARETLLTHIRERVGIPVDPAVTDDPARLLRLPYSLHTEVGRIVTPITSRSYDFRTEPIPSVLSHDD